jgi:CDK-activating kinase assembly factor MAT1
MSRVCVICQGTEKVLVAACSHNYCDGCVNRELLRGAFACFVCKTPVSRNSFINRTNNSSGGGVVSLTKEMKQRRRLAKIYNRVREDFRNEEEYYLFQEQAEELAYRVVRGEDCEHEIAAYKLANGPSIVARNQGKKVFFVDSLILKCTWNAENEARAREQREKDVREAEARVQREQEQQQQDRKDAVARLREREKAISNIQKGELDAREANKRVEAAMSKRRKRDEEQEAAAKEQQQQNTKKEKKNALPRPVGKYMHRGGVFLVFFCFL